MPVCLLCPQKDLTGGVRLSAADDWLCARCAPARLPSGLSVDELKTVLLLNKAKALTAAQLDAVARLTTDPTPHAAVADLTVVLAQLRKIGLVASAGGVLARTHRLTETGRLLKSILTG